MKKTFIIFFLFFNLNSFNVFWGSGRYYLFDYKRSNNVFLQLHCNTYGAIDISLGGIHFLNKIFCELSCSFRKKNFFAFLGLKYKNYMFRAGLINKSFSLGVSYFYKHCELELIGSYKSFIKLGKKNILPIEKNKIKKNKKMKEYDLDNELMFDDNISLHSETDHILQDLNSYHGSELNKGRCQLSTSLCEGQGNKGKLFSDGVALKKQPSTQQQPFSSSENESKRKKNNERRDVFLYGRNSKIKNSLCPIAELELRMKKISAPDLNKNKKNFRLLNAFISNQYIKLNDFFLKEKEQQLKGVQAFLASLRCKNFNKDSLKKPCVKCLVPVDECFAYVDESLSGCRKFVESLQFIRRPKKEKLEEFIEAYRKEHQKQKMDLFLSVADKLKYSSYSQYENKTQFLFDLYAFEIFDLMKIEVKSNDISLGAILKSNQNADNIKSIYDLKNLNFASFHEKLEKAAEKNKFANMWLNEFQQCLKKKSKNTEANKTLFYKKVLDKCKIFLILNNFIELQKGKKINVNFVLNNEIINAILDSSLDILTICNSQENLYKKFNDLIITNQGLTNKKLFKRNLQKENFNFNESYLKSAFKTHLKSDTIKSLNKNREHFNTLQLYLSTYNLLTQTKNNYIKEELQKSVKADEIKKENELIAKKAAENDKEVSEVLGSKYQRRLNDHHKTLNEFLDGVQKRTISPQLNRKLPINEYCGTLLYRSEKMPENLKKIASGFIYQGFDIEDFFINCLEKDSFVSYNHNQNSSDELKNYSSIFSFQYIYSKALKNIEKYRMNFMERYDIKNLKNIKTIIKKTKTLLSKELKNKQKLFQDKNISVFAFFQNLDYIKFQIEMIQNIMKNKDQYANYKTLINNIIIYPNMLNFVSDWPFIIDKVKKHSLGEKQTVLIEANHEILKNKSNKLIKYYEKKHVDANYLYYGRDFVVKNNQDLLLSSLSKLGASFDSFESYKNSVTFFNQSLASLYENYCELLNQKNNLFLLNYFLDSFKNSKTPFLDALKNLVENFDGNKKQLLNLILLAEFCGISVENIKKIYDLMSEFNIDNLDNISKKVRFMKSEIQIVKEEFISYINSYIKHNHSASYEKIKSDLLKVESTLKSRVFFEIFVSLNDLFTKFKGKISDFSVKNIEIFSSIITKCKLENSYENDVFCVELSNFLSAVGQYLNKHKIKKWF
ncbi:hypothetical protein [Alphaproteobacteria bacterium endosymbiont of Tiliacea citrago]|uniref:hypothetical protein n=1 Tax=Alphaproteobacteria bacterium endosymbiont of Tiliacea citrago TaxID=3077944 RepID=UPI00313B96D4